MVIKTTPPAKQTKDKAAMLATYSCDAPSFVTNSQIRLTKAPIKLVMPKPTDTFCNIPFFFICTLSFRPSNIQPSYAICKLQDLMSIKKLAAALSYLPQRHVTAATNQRRKSHFWPKGNISAKSGIRLFVINLVITN